MERREKKKKSVTGQMVQRTLSTALKTGTTMSSIETCFANEIFPPLSTGGGRRQEFEAMRLTKCHFHVDSPLSAGALK